MRTTSIIQAIALCAVAFTAESTFAVQECAELEGKSVEESAKYLAQPRASVQDRCVSYAMDQIGAKQYVSAAQILVQYVDYQVRDFSHVIGSSGIDVLCGMVRDSDGNFYAVGIAGAPDFPVTTDALQRAWHPGFLFKLSADASTLLYSTFLGANPKGGFVPQQIKIGTDGKLSMVAVSAQDDPPLNPDSYLPCYPASGYEWTYVRLTADLHAIEYATALPMPPVTTEDSGPFYFDPSGQIYLTTSIHGEPFFETIDVSAAPHSGPVCMATTAIQTSGPVAPGLSVSILGPGIGPDQPAPLELDSNGRVTTQLAGTQVLFDGIPAPILSAAPARIDVVTPFGVAASGNVTVSVLRNGESVGTLVNALSDYALALYSVDGSGYGAVAWNQDGTPNSASNPAQAGNILTFYGSGAGAMTPTPIDGAIPRSPQSTVVFQPYPFSPDVYPGILVPTYFGDAPGLVEGIVQINCRVSPYQLLPYRNGAYIASASTRSI